MAFWQQWSEDEVYPKQVTKTVQCLERFNTSCLGCVTGQLLDVGGTKGIHTSDHGYKICLNLASEICGK